MKKRGQVTLFVAIALVLVVSIVLVSVLKKDSPKQEEIQCNENSDCVPATCCHPDSCVSKLNAPNCEGAICTADCVPGTLDCGQEKCICKLNKCQTIAKWIIKKFI